MNSKEEIVFLSIFSCIRKQIFLRVLPLDCEQVHIAYFNLNFVWSCVCWVTLLQTQIIEILIETVLDWLLQLKQFWVRVYRTIKAENVFEIILVRRTQLLVFLLTFVALVFLHGKALLVTATHERVRALIATRIVSRHESDVSPRFLF